MKFQLTLIKIIVAVLFLALLAGIIWISIKKPFVEVIETNISAVVKEILPVSEYVCLIYNYQSISQRTYNPQSWISERHLLIVLDGTIKLGFDCAKIEVEKSGTELILKMPPIKVISHEQYPERAKSYDLAGGGLFPAKITPQEILDLLGESKSVHQEQIESNMEVIMQARNSVELLFEPLLKMNPAIREQYSITFSW